jgi:hypothetical protein
LVWVRIWARERDSGYIRRALEAHQWNSEP